LGIGVQVDIIGLFNYFVHLCVFDRLLFCLLSSFVVFIYLLEKLPTPFGLVRTGVAADHPEVKLAENNFTEVGEKYNCK
jgi:hypothetical protein